MNRLSTEDECGVSLLLSDMFKNMSEMLQLYSWQTDCYTVGTVTPCDLCSLCPFAVFLAVISYSATESVKDIVKSVALCKKSLNDKMIKFDNQELFDNNLHR